MAEKSRTVYSAKNTTVAMTLQAISILMGYLTRVVLIRTISSEYVGINGLFTNTLYALSLSELGIGNAIAYALYKSIAEKDIEKQKTLMKVCQKIYIIVAGILLAGGVIVLPFMDILIKEQRNIEHLTIIYLMYLLISVFSYLLVYKKTLIDAHQMGYISTLYHTFFLLVQYIGQIVVLLLTRNFILYVAVMLICGGLKNYFTSLKAERMYPYLKEKNVQELPKKEKKVIYHNIRAMLMHKTGDVLVNNTDNLLLSSIVGLVSVSKYSNYFLVIGSVRQVLNQMFQGITASVGNLGVEEGKEKIRRIFDASFFIGQWIFGLVSICLYELLDFLIVFSFGEQYVFSKDVTFILCLNFYLTGMRQAILVFRDSMGLFWYDRYKFLAEAFVNLSVSIILGKYIGTVGIFLGTTVSILTTSLWIEPYILYKYRLKVSSKYYFLRYALYASVTLLLWAGEDFLCRQLTGGLWKICISRLVICFIFTNVVYLLLYYRTKEFKLLVEKARNILNKFE